mmetsp:Transcript_51720/g.121337  ORF Transcript_51720/g.121337 Transcript_51720/m.121337 type:complete len:116 (+) Transcript_51720:107-454(+)
MAMLEERARTEQMAKLRAQDVEDQLSREQGNRVAVERRLAHVQNELTDTRMRANVPSYRLQEDALVARVSDNKVEMVPMQHPPKFPIRLDTFMADDPKSPVPPNGPRRPLGVRFR